MRLWLVVNLILGVGFVRGQGSGCSGDYRCGSSWDDANSKCGTECPCGTDSECSNGESCFADLSKSVCLNTFIRNATTLSNGNSNNNVICDENVPKCQIFCQSSHSCSDIEIHCPSNENSCESCEINCNGEYSCNNVTIYSNTCQFVDININSNNGMYQSTVYTPGNNGNLTIETHSFNQALSWTSIVDNNSENSGNSSKNSHNITINCFDETNSHSNECINNTFNVSNSNIFNFNCFANTECHDNMIYCPSNFEGSSNENSCNIVHTSNNPSKNKYYATNGWPIDIDLSYDSLTSYNEMDEIYCGNNYQSHCNVAISNNSITCDQCFYQYIDAITRIKNRNDHNIKCSSQSKNCFINCFNENGNGDSCNNANFYCHLDSSTAECDHCVINCASADVCNNMTVYASSCNYVTINAFDSNAISNSMMYIPENGNSLNINAKNVFYDKYELSDSIVSYFDNNKISTIGSGNTSNDENASSITFNCDNVACQNNVVNGTSASYVEMECENDANCSNNSIYCPTNNENKRFKKGNAACNIIFDNSKADSNSYYARDGIPRDIEFVWDPSTSTIYSADGAQDKLFCGNDFGTWCLLSDDNDGTCSECTFTSNAPSLIPSTIPSMMPSSEPSVSPSNMPSTIPTSMPTNVPSIDPTYNPSVTPSMMPSQLPTSAPSDEMQYKDIYLYYNYQSLSMSNDDMLANDKMEEFSQQLTNATALSILSVITYLNDSISSTQDDNDNDNARLLLNIENYIFESENWYQSQIMDLEYCILHSIEYDTNNCYKYNVSNAFKKIHQTLYNESYVSNITVEADYGAFGTFATLSNDNNDDFTSYISSIFKNDETNELFLDVLTLTMNSFTDNETYFEAVGMSIKAAPEFLVTTIRYVKPYIFTQFEITSLTILGVSFGIMLFIFVGLYLYSNYYLLNVKEGVNSDIIERRKMKLGPLLRYCFWTFDFISDILFCGVLSVHFEDSETTIDLFSKMEFGLLGINCFINFIAIYWYQEKCRVSPCVQHRVSQWCAEQGCAERISFYLCSIVNNGTFSMIDVCNCHMFGYDFFNMGLFESHLEEVKKYRILFTGLCFNFPQLCMQIIYFIYYIDINKAFSEPQLYLTGFDIIVMISTISTLISIILLVIDGCLTIRKYKEKENYLIQCYFFQILSPELAKKRKLLIRKPYPIVKAFEKAFFMEYNDGSDSIIINENEDQEDGPIATNSATPNSTQGGGGTTLGGILIGTLGATFGNSVNAALGVKSISRSPNGNSVFSQLNNKKWQRGREFDSNNVELILLRVIPNGVEFGFAVYIPIDISPTSIGRETYLTRLYWAICRGNGNGNGNGNNNNNCNNNNNNNIFPNGGLALGHADSNSMTIESINNMEFTPTESHSSHIHQSSMTPISGMPAMIKLPPRMNGINVYNSFVTNVQKEWNLRIEPIISNIETFYDLHDKYENREFRKDCDIVMKSQFHFENPWLFQFRDDGFYGIMHCSAHFKVNDNNNNNHFDNLGNNRNGVSGSLMSFGNHNYSVSNSHVNHNMSGNAIANSELVQPVSRLQVRRYVESIKMNKHKYSMFWLYKRANNKILIEEFKKREEKEINLKGSIINHILMNRPVLDASASQSSSMSFKERMKAGLHKRELKIIDDGNGMNGMNGMNDVNDMNDMNDMNDDYKEDDNKDDIDPNRNEMEEKATIEAETMGRDGNERNERNEMDLDNKNNHFHDNSIDNSKSKTSNGLSEDGRMHYLSYDPQYNYNDRYDAYDESKHSHQSHNSGTNNSDCKNDSMDKLDKLDKLQLDNNNNNSNKSNNSKNNNGNHHGNHHGKSKSNSNNEEFNDEESNLSLTLKSGHIRNGLATPNLSVSNSTQQQNMAAMAAMTGVATTANITMITSDHDRPNSASSIQIHFAPSGSDNNGISINITNHNSNNNIQNLNNRNSINSNRSNQYLGNDNNMRRESQSQNSQSRSLTWSKQSMNIDIRSIFQRNREKQKTVPELHNLYTNEMMDLTSQPIGQSIGQPIGQPAGQAVGQQAMEPHMPQDVSDPISNPVSQSSSNPC